MSQDPKILAEAYWHVDDIKEIRPSWSDERCISEMHEIERSFMECWIREGWEFLEILLPQEDNVIESDNDDEDEKEVRPKVENIDMFEDFWK